MSSIRWADLFSSQLSTVIQTGNKKLFESGNPMEEFSTQPLEGNPQDWAKDIFLGMSGKLDNVQKQSQTDGDNILSDGNQGGVQYTGNGNNTGVADYLVQLTENGNNIGTGMRTFQYTKDGDNTATAKDTSSKTLQYTEKGDNNTAGNTAFARVNQYSGEGDNNATGKNVYQYTDVGNNEATSTGENSYVMQTSKEGDNTVTNAQHIYQRADNGTNTATGTDGNDTIIQQGGGTANGGKGDDTLTVLDSDSGVQHYTFDGGDGYDKIKLYGQESDWSKEVTDGTVVYKNMKTGDTVTTKNVEDAEYGAKPPGDSSTSSPEQQTPPDTDYSPQGNGNQESGSDSSRAIDWS